MAHDLADDRAPRTARSCRCSDHPPELRARAEGTELWDSDGKRYLDFLSGIAVVSLGHANPVVADAIAGRPRRCCT